MTAESCLVESAKPAVVNRDVREVCNLDRNPGDHRSRSTGRHNFLIEDSDGASTTLRKRPIHARLRKPVGSGMPALVPLEEESRESAPPPITIRDVHDRQSPRLRLNGVCAYYAMFPLAFPYRQLLSAHPGEWVFDPFCGRGTTNMAARLLGLPSVGADSSPVASAIAAAKLCKVQPLAVVTACSKILDRDEPVRAPEGEFWELCYDSGTLLQICRVREALLRECRSDRQKVLRALMLGILHGPRRKGLPAYLSNQMPRTYATKPGSAVRFWRKYRMDPPKLSVLQVVKRKAEHYLSSCLPSATGMVIRRDSRRRLPNRFDGLFGRVVTSPPYLGMNHYLKDQWLRNWFVGGPDRPTCDSNPQIRTEDRDRFVSDLSKVWASVAAACRSGAKMTIRFGTIPSRKDDPWAIIRDSLDSSGADWRVFTVTSAGTALSGKRQSGQFAVRLGKPRAEIDVHAVLEDN